MKRIGLAAVMAGVLAAGAGAQTINSDSEFVPDGQPAYTCTSPRGVRTTCNKWLINKKRGWKQVCVEGTDEPIFGGRVDNNDLPVEIEHPESGCVMMFDREWADFRDFLAPNQTRERRRNLRPAHVRQLVEIHEPGTYQLSTCMVRSVHEVQEDDADNRQNLGGITVSLRQWHRRGSQTIHMVLPNKKARYGTNGIDGTEQNFDLLVDNIQNLPDDLERPIVVGETTTDNAYALSEIGHNSGYTASGKSKYYVDGYEGHAGLTQAYEGTGVAVADGTGFDQYSIAGWSCHQDTRPLEPGFYLIIAEVPPTNYQDTNDHQGWGAIREIKLTRISE
jgi:hypothetical protein